MSTIDSLTGDEFMHLDVADHRVALDQYERTIDAATTELAGENLHGPQRSQLLDRLTSLLTLRKLHKVRLAELTDDEQPVSKMGQGSYGATQLAPAA